MPPPLPLAGPHVYTTAPHCLLSLLSMGAIFHNFLINLNFLFPLSDCSLSMIVHCSKVLLFPHRDALGGYPCAGLLGLGITLSSGVTRLFGGWHQTGIGFWNVAPRLVPVPRSSPSLRGCHPHHPTSIPSPVLAPGPTGPKLGCSVFPAFPIPFGASLSAHPRCCPGWCGPAGVGSGCLPWLSPCLDFSPMTNLCPGPSALLANSSTPSLPALMSSRLSALPKNLPGHATRLHLGDLVSISLWWDFPSSQ